MQRRTAGAKADEEREMAGEETVTVEETDVEGVAQAAALVDEVVKEELAE